MIIYVLFKMGEKQKFVVKRCPKISVIYIYNCGFALSFRNLRMKKRNRRVRKPQIAHKKLEIARCYRMREIKCGALGWEILVNSIK